MQIRHRQVLSRGIVCLCSSLAASATAGAQQAGPADRTTRPAPVTAITAPIAIDGALDEPIWASAPTIGDLIQRQPLPGGVPTERTDVILLRDQDKLYIGVAA